MGTLSIIKQNGDKFSGDFCVFHSGSSWHWDCCINGIKASGGPHKWKDAAFYALLHNINSRGTPLNHG